MLVVIGCEERPEVPPEILQKTAEPTPSGVPRPTTQELVSGARSRTLLSPLPLTMELPPSWGRESLNDVPTPPNLLQGYTAFVYEGALWPRTLVAANLTPPGT